MSPRFRIPLKLWMGCVIGGLIGCSPPAGTIGAVLGQSPDGTVTLREVPEDLAAARAGLEPGDRLLLVDGEDVRALSARALHERLSGEVGAPVKLTLLRGDRVIRVTLKRTPAKRRSTLRP